MNDIQFRTIERLLAGYRDDAQVSFRQFVGGAVTVKIYNLTHFVTPRGSYITYDPSGNVLDESVEA